MSFDSFPVGEIYLGSGIQLRGYYRDRDRLIKDAQRFSRDLGDRIQSNMYGGLNVRTSDFSRVFRTSSQALEQALRDQERIINRYRSRVGTAGLSVGTLSAPTLDPRAFAASQRQVQQQGAQVGQSISEGISSGLERSEGDIRARFQGVITRSILTADFIKFGVRKLFESSMKGLGGQATNLVRGTLTNTNSLQEMVNLQTEMISSTTAFSSLAGVSYEEAGLAIERLNNRLAKSAAALPGVTTEYQFLARSINDNVLAAFKNTQGILDTTGFENTVSSISESFGALNASSVRDIGNTSLALSRALGGASTAELRQFAFFEQNPQILNAIENQLQTVGAEALRDLTLKSRTTLIENIGKQFVTDDLKAQAERSVDGLLQSLRSRLFDPNQGILGINRDLDKELKGTQSVFSSFNNVLFNLISQSEDDLGLLFRAGEAAKKAGLNIADPLLGQKRILDAINQAVKLAKGNIDNLFNNSFAQGIIRLANTTGTVLSTLGQRAGDLIQQMLPVAGNLISGIGSLAERSLPNILRVSEGVASVLERVLAIAKVGSKLFADFAKGVRLPSLENLKLPTLRRGSDKQDRAQREVLPVAQASIGNPFGGKAFSRLSQNDSIRGSNALSTSVKGTYQTLSLSRDIFSDMFTTATKIGGTLLSLVNPALTTMFSITTELLKGVRLVTSTAAEFFTSNSDRIVGVGTFLLKTVQSLTPLVGHLFKLVSNVTRHVSSLTLDILSSETFQNFFTGMVDGLSQAVKLMAKLSENGNLVKGVVLGIGAGVGAWKLQGLFKGGVSALGGKILANKKAAALEDQRIGAVKTLIGLKHDPKQLPGGPNKECMKLCPDTGMVTEIILSDKGLKTVGKLAKLNAFGSKLLKPLAKVGPLLTTMTAKATAGFSAIATVGVGAVAAALAGVIAAGAVWAHNIYQYRKNWDDVVLGVTYTANQVREGLGSALNFVWERLQPIRDIWSDVTLGVTYTASQIRQGVGDALDATIGKVNLIYQGFKDKISPVITFAGELITGIVERLDNWLGISEKISFAWEGIKSLGQGIRDSVTGVIDYLRIDDTIKAGWEGLKSIAESITSTLGGAFEHAKGMAGLGQARAAKGGIPGASGGTGGIVGVIGNTGIGTGAHLDIRYNRAYANSAGLITAGGHRARLSDDVLSRFEVNGKTLDQHSDRITSEHGYRTHPVHGGRRHHDGVDFGFADGTEIRATVPVKDTKVWFDKNGGGWVTTVTFEDGVSVELLHQNPEIKRRIGEGATSPVVAATTGAINRVAGTPQAPAGSVQSQVYQGLIQRGLSPLVSAGFTGNIGQESSYDPSVVNSIGATGLVQWLGDRKDNLMSFADQSGQAWSSVGTQLDFIIHELMGSGGSGGGSEAGAWRRIQAAESTGDLNKVTETIARAYERMGEHEIHLDKRIRYAEQVAGTQPNATITVPATSTTPTPVPGGEIDLTSQLQLNAASIAERALAQLDREQGRERQLMQNERQTNARNRSLEQEASIQALRNQAASLPAEDSVGKRVIELQISRSQSSFGFDQRITKAAQDEEDLIAARTRQRAQRESLEASTRQFEEGLATGEITGLSREKLKQMQADISPIDYDAAIADIQRYRAELETLKKEAAQPFDYQLRDLSASQTRNVDGLIRSTDKLFQQYGQTSELEAFNIRISELNRSFDDQSKQLEITRTNLENLLQIDTLSEQQQQALTASLDQVTDRQTRLNGVREKAIALAKEEFEVQQAKSKASQELNRIELVGNLLSPQSRLLGAQARQMEQTNPYGANELRRQQALLELSLEREKAITQEKLRQAEVQRQFNQALEQGNQGQLSAFAVAGINEQEDLDAYFAKASEDTKAFYALQTEEIRQQFPTLGDDLRNNLSSSFSQAFSNGLTNIAQGGNIGESIKGIFVNMGQSIVQKGIEMLTQSATNGLFGDGKGGGLLGGLFGGTDDEGSELPQFSQSAAESLGQGGFTAGQNILNAALQAQQILSGVNVGGGLGAGMRTGNGNPLALPSGPGSSLGGAFGLLGPGGTGTFSGEPLTKAGGAIAEGIAASDALPMAGEGIAGGLGGVLQQIMGSLGGSGSSGGGLLGGLFNFLPSLFHTGGQVPNYAGGGLIGAMKRERLASGRTPIPAFSKGGPLVVNSGEYIISAPAVKRVGVGSLDKINFGGTIPNFYEGGAIGGDNATGLAPYNYTAPRTEMDSTNRSKRSSQTFKFETQRIGDMDVVTADQLSALENRLNQNNTPEQGARLALDVLKNDYSARANVGLG